MLQIAVHILVTFKEGECENNQCQCRRLWMHVACIQILIFIMHFASLMTTNEGHSALMHLKLELVFQLFRFSNIKQVQKKKKKNTWEHRRFYRYTVCRPDAIVQFERSSFVLGILLLFGFKCVACLSPRYQGTSCTKWFAANSLTPLCVSVCQSVFQSVSQPVKSAIQVHCRAEQVSLKRHLKASYLS